MTKKNYCEKGIVLASVMMFLVLFSALMASFYVMASSDLKVVSKTIKAQTGYNTAEGGLTLRVSELKNSFFSSHTGIPHGTPPAGGIEDCGTAQGGSGAFACKNYTFSTNQTAVTTVFPDSSNPDIRVIPPGQIFQGLHSETHRFHIYSAATDGQGNNHELQKLIMSYDLIPMFQFQAFWMDDLVFYHTEAGDTNGALFSNNNMFIESYENTLYDGTIVDTYLVDGPVVSGRLMYEGMKSVFAWKYSNRPCFSEDTIYFNDGNGNISSIAPGTNCQKNLIDTSDWETNIVATAEDKGVNITPVFERSDVNPGNKFWKGASIRIVLNLDDQGNPVTTNSPTGIEVRNIGGTLNSEATAALNDARASCRSADDDFRLQNYFIRSSFTNTPVVYTLGMRRDSDGNIIRAETDGDGNVISIIDPNVVDPDTDEYRFNEPPGKLLRIFNEHFWDLWRTELLNWGGPDYPIYDPWNSISEYERTLELDVAALLNCINSNHGIFGYTTADSGFIVYLTIDGPLSSSTFNNYTIRLRNAENLSAASKGISFVTDQRLAFWGDFNSNDSNWVPASVVADKVYLLSNGWKDDNSLSFAASLRPGTDTTIQAAILAGSMIDGRINGTYSTIPNSNFLGGYPYFLGVNESGPFKFNFTGSMVSLWTPQHSDAFYIARNWNPTKGATTKIKAHWGLLQQRYYASVLDREWRYDIRFNDINRHPPISPRALVSGQPEVFSSIYENVDLHSLDTE